jgi:hypothetical protein
MQEKDDDQNLDNSEVSSEHVHGSTELHQMKTRIKKIIFVVMIRRMIRIKTMIGTCMTQRS